MISPFLPVKKPVSVLRKPLAPRWGGLFKSLTRGIGAGTTLQWQKLAESLVDMGASLGLHTSPEERAGALVLRAMARAVSELVIEHQADLPRDPADGAGVDHLDDILEACEIEIDRSFLDQPANVGLPEAVAPLLAEWFEMQGVRVANREALKLRLRAYFVYALIAEWRRKPADYTPILDALDTPFARAGEQEHAWLQYAAALRQQVNRPMFMESFGLEQVYVPLRAAHVVRHKRDARAVFMQGKDERRKPHVVMLREHIRDWVKAKDKDDAIRLLSGGPGSGKSSFAKMFAVELAESHRVLFIPLFDLDLHDSLPAAVDAYLERHGLPFHGLLTARSHEEHLVIIFDGLDELSIRGSLGMETARGFISQVERVLRDMNHDRCRLQVLITGRELAIQGAESELREPERVLRMLPYYLPDHKRQHYEDPAGYLAEDQRVVWWTRYSALTGREEGDPLPAQIARKDLEELTGEPLLCYLIAFAYCERHIDISSPSINLGRIYEGLLRGVHQRSYERRHRSLEQISEFDDFAAILEEIGLAAWHGRSRTTTIATVRAYCHRNQRLRKLLQGFETNAKAGMTSLLLAFYFRQSEGNRSGEPTFEFTHLSFGEYLTARRLVRVVERMVSNCGQTDRTFCGQTDPARAVIEKTVVRANRERHVVRPK